MLVMLTAGSAMAGVLVYDDFNDGVIDASKWQSTAATGSGVPASPPSAATETGGQLQLANRVHFFTVDQIRPADHAFGIRITGQWTFVSGDDFIQILTRSNAVPTGTYGETQYGIEFVLRGHDDSVSIAGRGGSIANHTGDSTLVVGAGDIVAFDIFDDGFNVSLTFTKLTGGGGSATRTATSTYNPATNYVVFHNREGRTSTMDNVAITAIPEPATALLLVPVLGLFARGRR